MLMSNGDAINRLEDLKEHCESMIDEFTEENNLWKRDVQALDVAILSLKTRTFEFSERKDELKMKNIEMKLNGNILTITADLSKDFGASKSGKSITVASTEGNQSIPDTDCKIGLNIYKKA